MAVFSYDQIITNGTDFDSSWVDVVAYNIEEKLLYVETDRAEYVYQDVLASTFAAISEANSIGTFIGSYIMGKFTRVAGYEGLEKRVSAQAVEPALGNFSVTWYSDGVLGGSQLFEPQFSAEDEADALDQLQAQIATIFGQGFEFKVKAVTHHFE